MVHSTTHGMAFTVTTTMTSTWDHGQLPRARIQTTATKSVNGLLIQSTALITPSVIDLMMILSLLSPWIRTHLLDQLTGLKTTIWLSHLSHTTTWAKTSDSIFVFLWELKPDKTLQAAQPFLVTHLANSSHTTSTKLTKFTSNSHSMLPMHFTTKVVMVPPLLVVVSAVFQLIQVLLLIHGGEQSTMITITIQLTWLPLVMQVPTLSN